MSDMYHNSKIKQDCKTKKNTENTSEERRSDRKFCLFIKHMYLS